MAFVFVAFLLTHSVRVYASRTLDSEARRTKLIECKGNYLSSTFPEFHALQAALIL